MDSFRFRRSSPRLPAHAHGMRVIDEEALRARAISTGGQGQRSPSMLNTPSR
jgi:hypothetical protein